jgi:hypothetical protein
MASIIREFTIDAPPDRVWDVIGDFADGPRRIAPAALVESRLEEPGIRAITFADGTVARERLVARDEQACRIVWSWVADEVIHDNTSMQVFAQGQGRSRIVWIHDTLPDELCGWLADAMDGLVPVFRQAFPNHRP